MNDTRTASHVSKDAKNCTLSAALFKNARLTLAKNAIF